MMLIIRNLNRINVQFWTYLDKVGWRKLEASGLVGGGGGDLRVQGPGSSLLFCPLKL